MPDTLKLHTDVTGPRPRCFSPDQWEVHVRAEKKMLADGSYVYNEAGFCGECTPKYKAEQCRRGHCRHPNVIFVADEDGDLCGVRPKGTITPALKELIANQMRGTICLSDPETHEIGGTK